MRFREKNGTVKDEPEKQKIRELIETWMRATRESNLELVLSLMADDVVFLLPGRPPMRGKDGFAAASRGASGKMKFEGKPEIQEIQIAGDFAFCWNYLAVTITPLEGGGAPMSRAGHILSVFRKEPDGRWLLYRDANLLTAVR
jgi:uncharacterized protein (TIGR02246 family)